MPRSPQGRSGLELLILKKSNGNAAGVKSAKIGQARLNQKIDGQGRVGLTNQVGYMDHAGPESKRTGSGLAK